MDDFYKLSLERAKYVKHILFQLTNSLWISLNFSKKVLDTDYKSLSTAWAILFSLVISSVRIWGVMDWAPSEAACSGSG